MPYPRRAKDVGASKGGGGERGQGPDVQGCEAGGLRNGVGGGLCAGQGEEGGEGLGGEGVGDALGSGVSDDGIRSYRWVHVP